MIQKKDHVKIDKGVIIAFVILAILIVFFLMLIFGKDSVKGSSLLQEVVVDKEKNWNIFYLQNQISSGDYMGYIYERDYTVNTLSKKFLSSLVVDNYIANNDFFIEDNEIGDDLYAKELDVREINNLYKQIVGPDIKINIEDVSYGCGRSLTKKGNKYVIEAKFPDTCGMMSNGYNRYMTNIKDYYEKDKNVVIELQVAYVEDIIEETELYDGDIIITHNVYNNKDKDKLLVKNISGSCINTDKPKESCFKSFPVYLVTLKEASDGNYYFYSIEKK